MPKDLFQEAGQPIDLFQKAGISEKVQITPEQQQLIDSMNPIEKMLVGIGYGMTQAGKGIGQRILEGGELIRKALGMESNQSNIDALAQSIAQDRKDIAPLMDRSTMATVGKYVGEVAPYAVIPGGSAARFIPRTVNAIGQGATIGLLQPTTGEDSVGSNMMLGAIGGGVGSTALSGITKAGNAIFNKLPQNMREALSKRYGVPMTLGESLDNPTIQKAETWLETVPLIGIKKFREKTYQDSNQAVNELLARFIYDPKAVNIESANRRFSSNMFDKLTNIVQGIDSQEIIPAQTRMVAQEGKDAISDMFKLFQNTRREKLLNNIITDTEGNTATTFKDMWQLRDSLGDLIGMAKSKLAKNEIDRTQYAELSKLFNAVNNDIDTWAQSIGRPDIRDAINAANEAYKQYVVKFKVLDNAYKKAATSTEVAPDGTVLYKDISPVRFANNINDILKKENAMKMFSQEEIEHMSGIANLLQATKRSGQYKENPPTGNRWGSIQTLLTGIGVGGAGGVLGATAGAAATAKATAATGSAILLARWLTTTESGKRLAMAASRMEPNNPNLRILASMAENQIPKAIASGALSLSRDASEY